MRNLAWRWFQLLAIIFNFVLYLVKEMEKLFHLNLPSFNCLLDFHFAIKIYLLKYSLQFRVLFSYWNDSSVVWILAINAVFFCINFQHPGLVSHKLVNLFLQILCLSLRINFIELIIRTNLILLCQAVFNELEISINMGTDRHSLILKFFKKFHVQSFLFLD